MSKFIKFWPLVLIILFSATPVLWFYGKGDVLIDGVDTNFPLNPAIWFSRRFYVWNSIINAGADFSSSTAGLFFHLIQVIPYQLGLNLQHVQIVSFIFWFSLIVFSAYVLARAIVPNKPLIQLLFVTLYSFNIYLFNSWENVKVANLSLVAAIPLAITILFLLYKKKISYTKAGFYSVISGIILSGTGINPAYFICFILVIFFFFMGQFIATLNKKNFLSTFKETFFVVVLIILVNLFWILPTMEFILRTIPSSQSITEIGFTNWLFGLSENTSLLNIFRLQGVWDWYALDPKTGVPLYIPYVLNYFYSLPFIIFSFLITLLVILSFIFYRKKGRHLYMAFGLMFLVGVFLGAGAHLPTGAIFLWLAGHVPFFTLFRSPWYIFTPLVVLSYAGLISLFFYNLDERIDENKLKTGKLILPLIVLLFIAGALVFSYPLIRGDIFRPGRKDGFYVKFPAYVFETQKKNAGDNEGRIASFPDENVEVFDWGYRGIDSILGLLTNREVLFTPFQGDDRFVSRLIKEFFLNIKKGEMESAKAIAGKLNISSVFIKKDQVGQQDNLPAIFKNGFESFNMGRWTFAVLPKEVYIPKIFSPDHIFLAYPYTNGDNILSGLPGKDIVLSPEDSIITGLPRVMEESGKAILAENSQVQDLLGFEIEPGLLNRLKMRNLNQVVYNFEIVSNGSYQPLLERYQLEDFGIDVTKSLEVDLDEKRIILNIANLSDSFVRFAPLELTAGRHKITIKLATRNIVKGGNFEEKVEFERDGDGRDLAVYEMMENGGNKFLSILNTSIADANVNWKILPFDPLADYYIEVKYRQVYGKDARVLVSQTGDFVSRNQIEHLPNYPEWRPFSFYFRPSKIQSTMDVKLVASAVNDPLGTKVAYDDLKVYKVFSNKMLLLNENDKKLITAPNVKFKKISPVQYEGVISGANNPHLLVFSENYSSQWELMVQNMQGERINLIPPHFSANLYANAWFLENTPKEYKFKIYYKPQNLFLTGSIISGVTLILSLAAFVFWGIIKGRGNNE